MAGCHIEYINCFPSLMFFWEFSSEQLFFRSYLEGSSEAYSGTCQTHMMELFMEKIINYHYVFKYKIERVRSYRHGKV